MVAILPPDISLTFIFEALLPLIIGFIVGLLIKKSLKIGLLIAAILLLLIVAGFLSPDQVLKPLFGFLKSSSNVSNWVKRVAGYLPYTSLAFIVGLAVGFLKG
ncbi:MAG: hypothetical protein ABR867_02970 [Nitrososphaerales archaeon]